MPERFVRNAFREVHGDGPFLLAGLTERSGEKSVVAPWNELAKSVLTQGGFSNVSVEAMRYRLVSLNLVRDKESASLQPNLM
jgi:hypothetical protein